MLLLLYRYTIIFFMVVSLALSFVDLSRTLFQSGFKVSTNLTLGRSVFHDDLLSVAVFEETDLIVESFFLIVFLTGVFLMLVSFSIKNIVYIKMHQLLLPIVHILEEGDFLVDFV